MSTISVESRPTHVEVADNDNRTQVEVISRRTQVVIETRGIRGMSAYEVAVSNGFVGTEDEWLATLGSDDAFNTDLALLYQIAKE